jgi:hypothetical protein
MLSMGGNNTYSCSELASILLRLGDPDACVRVQSGGASEACCGLLPPSSSPAGDDTSCDPYSDPCPYAADSICGNYDEQSSVLDPGHQLCLGAASDCIDCDPCGIYSGMTCDVCTFVDGCHWCPSDGTCTSFPYSQRYYPPPLVTLPRSCTLGEGGTGGFSPPPSSSSWKTTCSDVADKPVFNDPSYLDNAWAFRMINVEPVWRVWGLTGRGVHIRINDVGVDATAVDLSANFDVDASCDSYLPASPADSHGTACASIAAAAADNGACSVGIAPGATLSSCRLPALSAARESPDDLNPLLHALDRQDVSSNSFGFPACVPRRRQKEQPERMVQQSSTPGAADECPFLPGPSFLPCSACGGALAGDIDSSSAAWMDSACARAVAAYCSDPFAYEADADACVHHLELFSTCSYNALAPSYQQVLTTSIRQGRNGKGLVVVFSAGNEYGTGSDANMVETLSSRFTIAVGAVGKDGRHALYSTPGACLHVSAPGGDVESATNWITAQPGGGCADSAFGTSLAAPVVAGVAALLLEANPSLTWRDVQGILAQTSQKVHDPSRPDAWATNGAGYSHSYLYGFGIVDAAAAVQAASNWTNFGPERMVTASSGVVNLTVDDSGTVVNSTVRVALGATAAMTVESVVVYLDVEASSRGHLEVRLTSPAGTESILAPGMRPSSTQIPESARWKLTTVRSWGESARGAWTLSVADTERGDYSASNATTGCVDLPYGDGDDYYYYFVPDCPTVERSDGPSGCAGMPRVREACCFCGGGQPASSIRDRLVSWTIVIYGRNGTSSYPPLPPPSAVPASPAANPPAPTVRSETVRPTYVLAVDTEQGTDANGIEEAEAGDGTGGDHSPASSPSSSSAPSAAAVVAGRPGRRSVLLVVAVVGYTVCHGYWG